MPVDGPYLVDVDGSDDLDHVEARALMESMVGERAFGPHEMAAYHNGFPPGYDNTAVVTPQKYQSAVVAGDIALVDTPMGAMDESLKTHYGPRQDGPGLRETHMTAARGSDIKHPVDQFDIKMV